MAVDIKSLRIGSHILVDGKRERVRGLDDGVGLLVRFPAEYTLASEVEPIPITPELLKELGFVRFSAGLWQSWGKDGVNLQCRGGSGYWHFNGKVAFEYLHELENLYYMIYETELIPD